MKLTFVVKGITNQETITVKTEFCCYSMYLASSIYQHIKLGNRPDEKCKLQDIYISHCPYCGKEIIIDKEKVSKEIIDETETVRENKNVAVIQGCGRKCSDENTEGVCGQRSEDNSKLSNDNTKQN